MEVNSKHNKHIGGGPLVDHLDGAGMSAGPGLGFGKPKNHSMLRLALGEHGSKILY